MAERLRAEPDPQQLLAYTEAVHRLLQGRKLLIATTHVPYANELVLQLRDENPKPPRLPQKLLAVCDSIAAVESHLPSDSTDVIVFLEEVLSDGAVLPVLSDLCHRPSPPAVVLTLSPPLVPAVVRSAWRSGIQSLLFSHDYRRGEMAAGLAALVRGERYHGPAFSDLLNSCETDPDTLTLREHEVLQQLAEGLTNKQIAIRLQIAEVTARDHVNKILQKFQVKSRGAAVALAVRLGLV